MKLEEGEILKNLWGKNLDKAKGKVLKKLCKERESSVLTNYLFCKGIEQVNSEETELMEG